METQGRSTPIQTLDVMDDRWDALLEGRKLDTIRIDEGSITPGFLVYQSYPSGNRFAVVFVTDVWSIPLRDVPIYSRDVERRADPEVLLLHMRPHYRDIALDTVVDFVEHLSPVETRERYPDEVAAIFAALAEH